MNNKNCIALTVMLSCLSFWGTGKGLAQQHTITVTKSGTGSGTVTSSPTGINCGPACSGTFNEGKTVTLKAKADSGSTFKEWGGGSSETNPTCKVTPNADLTITATFALPDLYGEWSDISIQQSKSIYSVSGKLTVYASEGKAVNVKANVYLSDDEIYDSGDTLLGVVSFGTINAASSKFKNVKYKSATDPSEKYLIAVIDPGDIVDESNEDNNFEGTLFSYEVSKVIGPEGGTIEVTDPTSPLYGVKVEVPPGAVDSNETFRIGRLQASPPFPTSLQKISETVLLEPKGMLFNIPVSVSIPYDDKDVLDKNMLSVYRYDEATSAWNAVTVKDIGPKSMVTESRHFSSFQVMEVIEAPPQSFSLDFETNRDGFSIKNDPLWGQCYGMVAFTAWYWENKRLEYGNLSNKYSECEAEQVAKEGQNKLHNIVLSNYVQPSLWIANMLVDGIGNNRPQILGLYKSGFPVGHAVLVYRYDGRPDSSIAFHIYDPDIPGIAGNDIMIEFRDFKFASYKGYDSFYLVGWDLFYNHSVLESIFNLEMMPKIENVSPTGTVKGRRPTISASIKSSLRDIDLSKIAMILDNHTVAHIDSGSQREVVVSYTPNYDLSIGMHTVGVLAYDVEDIYSCPKVWTFNVEEKCDNVAGNWTGRPAVPGGAYETYRITLKLSQDNCNVTGTIESPESCPGQCGMSMGTITGSVSENVFSLIIHDDPTVDCDTCEVICYGTDQGSLTVDGNKMHGIVESEDCEIEEYNSLTLNLTRSSVGLSSVEPLERRKNIKKSSILRPFTPVFR